MTSQYWYNGVLLLNAGATLYMVGLIWFVQVVHYPMYAQVGEAQFSKYENTHVQLTTWVVLPPMLVELVTSLLLLMMAPTGIPKSWLWAGFLLVLLIWLSTFFLQVPQHDRLARGFDGATHQFLVRSNWIRTIAWSLRGLLVLLLLRVK
ncbi:MAG: hypothetical protein ACFCD0_16250 [Gemmataceae bacterium]